MNKDNNLRTAAPAQPSLLWALNDSWVLTKRSVKHIVKSLDQLLSVVITPVMFLLLFRYVFGGAINTGGISYVNFLVAGILVQTAAFGASTTTYSIAIDLQRGIVDRFRSLPMFTPALLIGHIVADLVRNTLSTLIMLGVSLLVGFRPVASPSEWLMAFGLLLLFTFAFSWLSAILGLMVRTLEAAQWISFLVTFPLTFASSAFVPTDGMPKALKIFADHQPITKVIDAMRAWFVGTPVGNSAWVSVLWCIGIILVCAPIATGMLRRYTPR